MGKILFNSYNPDYNWLSNFYQQEHLIKFYIFGKFEIEFKSVEAAFQSLKLFHLNETRDQNSLLNSFIYFSTLSNGYAKKEGNKLNLNVNDWNNLSLSYMKELIERKFNNENLKRKLLETIGHELVEYNTGSTFWGVNSKMEGQNNLGKIIMKVREKCL